MTTPPLNPALRELVELPDPSFLYVMHDCTTGWSKFGYSGTPYARLHHVRRDYRELRNARLVGVVRVDRCVLMLEGMVDAFVADFVAAYGGEMAGERFRCDQLSPQEVLVVAGRIAEELGIFSAAWSVLK